MRRQLVPRANTKREVAKCIETEFKCGRHTFTEYAVGGQPRSSRLRYDTPMDPTQARRQMQVRVFRTLEEHDRADAEYWAALPPEERTLQVWKLSEAQWRLQGDGIDPIAWTV